MTWLEAYCLAGIAITALMLALWAASLLLHDASIVDIFWGVGFVICAWLYFALTPQGYAGRKWLVCILVSAWGLRLALHILRRNWGKGEDYRYRAWRQAAGRRWWWLSLFKVFLLQGALLWVISIPLLAAQSSPTPAQLTWLDAAGLLAWGVGFTFETLGDWQLQRFKADPANRGKVLQQGLWRTTRHPNYFGDACAWWGTYLLAGSAGGWWTVYSPLLMTFLLARVSGAAMLERSLAQSIPGYREYMQTTSAFIPWKPRKIKDNPDRPEKEEE
jgi:steroid 5-alpha reductase family enzyme